MILKKSYRKVLNRILWKVARRRCCKGIIKVVSENGRVWENGFECWKDLSVVSEKTKFNKLDVFRNKNFERKDVFEKWMLLVEFLETKYQPRVGIFGKQTSKESTVKV